MAKVAGMVDGDVVVKGEQTTMAAPSRDRVYLAAIDYVDAGLSVIPIKNDGSKRPDCSRLPLSWDDTEQRFKRSWKVYQSRRPEFEEVFGWSQLSEPFGLAVVGGAVSGGVPGNGLEIIDFDTVDLVGPWTQAVENRCPGLVERLVRVRSPRPGSHFYYRCSEFGGYQNLAAAPLVDEKGLEVRDARTGKLKKKTLIELKARGGYTVAPPSPASCHPSGRLYELGSGSPPLTRIPAISPEERAVLLDAARGFNQWHEPDPPPPQRPEIPPQIVGGRPGDDFNARATWQQILVPHGWVLVDCQGEVEYWRRPGKSTGISASVNYAATDLLYVFSSNADPLEQDRAYTKFVAYAFLEHGGDFQEAAWALQEMGYGAPVGFEHGPGGRCLRRRRIPGSPPATNQG